MERNPLLLDFPDAFESARLLLRAPRPGDGRELYLAVHESLEHLQPWMPWAHQPQTPESAEAWARKGQAHFLQRTDLPLLLFLKDNGILIGGSGLHHIEWSVPRFEIGYWLRQLYQGYGYMSEAVEAITRFAFDTLGAERVEIRMDDKNRRSWRVAERAGYTLEGILRRDARSTDGDLRDTRVYALVRAEYLSRRGR